MVDKSFYDKHSKELECAFCPLVETCTNAEEPLCQKGQMYFKDEKIKYLESEIKRLKKNWNNSKIQQQRLYYKMSEKYRIAKLGESFEHEKGEKALKEIERLNKQLAEQSFHLSTKVQLELIDQIRIKCFQKAWESKVNQNILTLGNINEILTEFRKELLDADKSAKS